MKYFFRCENGKFLKLKWENKVRIFTMAAALRRFVYFIYYYLQNFLSQNIWLQFILVSMNNLF